MFQSKKLWMLLVLSAAILAIDAKADSLEQNKNTGGVNVDKKIIGILGYRIGEKINLSPLTCKKPKVYEIAGDAPFKEVPSPGSAYTKILEPTCVVTLRKPSKFFDSAALTIDVDTREIAEIWGFRDNKESSCVKDVPVLKKALKDKYPGARFVERKMDYSSESIYQLPLVVYVKNRYIEVYCRSSQFDGGVLIVGYGDTPRWNKALKNLDNKIDADARKKEILRVKNIGGEL